jgi:hypothetical protein
MSGRSSPCWRGALAIALPLVACRVDFDRDRLQEPPPKIVERPPVEKCPAPAPQRCSRAPFEAPTLLVRNRTSSSGSIYDVGAPAIRMHAGKNELWLHFQASSIWRLGSIPVNDAFVPERTDWSFFEDLIPVLNSAGAVNVDPAFGASGDWIVWSTRVAPGNPMRLRFASFDASANDWRRPVALEGFDGIGKEQYGPSPNANGCRLFFSAGERDKSGDVYLAEGEPGAWSAPRRLENPADLASTYDDTEPTASADGTTVIFASNRESKGAGLHDLWIARQESGDAASPVFAAPVKLASDGVNTTADERGAFLSPDGCTLIFQRGSEEIWISRRQPDAM